MIHRPLQPDDVVQICLPVDDEPEPPVFGSVQIQCDECHRAMWRAPGRPLAQLSVDDQVLRPAPLVMPEVTRWLCTRCGAAAWLLATAGRKHGPGF